MTQAKEKKIINFPSGPEGHLALLPWNTAGGRYKQKS